MNNRPDLPKLLLDNLLTAVILLDKQLVVRYVNPAAEQLMGVSARRLLDHALEQVVDYISLDTNRLRHCLIQGQGFTDNEVTLVVEDEPRSVEVSVIAIYDQHEQMALLELRSKNGSVRNNSNILSRLPPATWFGVWLMKLKIR